jgi:hypothetical protein
MVLPTLEYAAFAHGEGVPIGGKTIAGPGKEILEQAKSTVVLQSQTPIPPACITVMNMNVLPITIHLNDAPTHYEISNTTSAYCWGKGIKKVSLHVNDPKETKQILVFWRIDVQ